MTTEYWEDVIPDRDEDGEEAYIRFFDRLHEFTPGERDEKWGTYRCTAKMQRRDGTFYTCNGSSHDSMHQPIEDCCYCKHGVYLHTSYDISCGRCEVEDYD